MKKTNVPAASRAVPDYLFNRAPLVPKPFAELPLGAVKPLGWLRDELQLMADGMTGHLDEWYPEVCGPRNAWLGGDGDAWERGPYWLDGLCPLSHLLADATLIDKVKPWIEWTLTTQREDGYIGPRGIDPSERTRPPPEGAQAERPDDWWPRMVMLKVLQQHYMATGDQRVIDVMTRYFRYQLEKLPDEPLRQRQGRGGTWWAEQRGGENLMSVLWLYNITEESWLLDLADILYEQTLPWTRLLSDGEAIRLQADQPGRPYDMVLFRGHRPWAGNAFHCVNLAMGFKTPVMRFQQDGDPRHLDAVRKGLKDIDALQGQPQGLYGGDERLHGAELHRGTELCTAVEMMFSMEKMMEVTGDVLWADRLERVAFNILPTQTTRDHRMRQYFQQANQVQVTFGNRGFVDEYGGSAVVYGFLEGYPCCTANYHQGWPKYTQHLWMASADGGLAALVYGPSQVTARVAGGEEVRIQEDTAYPFEESIRFTIHASKALAFPLHLRIPGWCETASVRINGCEGDARPEAGTVLVLDRTWQPGDTIELALPMTVRATYWHELSVALERGPLLFALRVEAECKAYESPYSYQAPELEHPRMCREFLPRSPWNYAMRQSVLEDLAGKVRVEQRPVSDRDPWTLDNAPVELHTEGVRLDDWTVYRNSAGPVPRSPVPMPENPVIEPIRLVPYGCTILRVSGFPWVAEATG